MRTALRIALLSLVCLLAVSAFAQDTQSAAAIRVSPDPQTRWEAWELAMFKTATYRVFVSLDIVVGGYLVTGSELKTAALVAVVAGSKSIAYFIHELFWDYDGPHPDGKNAVDLGLEKSISYSFVSTGVVLSLSRFLVSPIGASPALLAVDAVYTTSVFFLNEMLWSRYGPQF